MLLLDLVALERVRLVGITVGLTLTSPVTDFSDVERSVESIFENNRNNRNLFLLYLFESYGINLY